MTSLHLLACSGTFDCIAWPSSVDTLLSHVIVDVQTSTFLGLFFVVVFKGILKLRIFV